MQKSPLMLSLLAAVVAAGCSTVPPRNSALSEAQGSYESARSSPQVSRLAPLELQEAGEALKRAEAAQAQRDEEARINQLAYLAKQKVAIAQQVTRRKTAELEVANSSVERDRVRLEARTAEADAAQKRAQMAQQMAEQRAQALAEASAKAQRDEALIAARSAEVEQAQQQALIAQRAAEQQAEALAIARARAESDQALLAARIAEIEQAKQQTAAAQKSAEEQAAALAASQAKVDKAQALIAQQEMQLEALNAKKTDRGMVITLGDVLFNVDKAKLSAGGINNVQKLAEFLTTYPERKVLIEGHTDSRGSTSHNQALSERRAEAVKKALLEMGVAADRVTARGMGEAAPVANNETPAGRQLNRRVEIILPDDAKASGAG